MLKHWVVMLAAAILLTALTGSALQRTGGSLDVQSGGTSPENHDHVHGESHSSTHHRARALRPASLHRLALRERPDIIQCDKRAGPLSSQPTRQFRVIFALRAAGGLRYAR
jgi:hypothetical protein